MHVCQDCIHICLVIISGSEGSEGGGELAIQKEEGAERSMSSENVCRLRSLNMVGSV